MTKIKLITLKEYNGKESIKSLLMDVKAEYLSVKELVEWLPWKAANIRKLIRSGRIKGRKIEKEWYVSREALYNFLRGI
ncbi:hypothetical protein ES705_38990 [subsurface metagenome]